MKTNIEIVNRIKERMKYIDTLSFSQLCEMSKTTNKKELHILQTRYNSNIARYCELEQLLKDIMEK